MCATRKNLAEMEATSAPKRHRMASNAHLDIPALADKYNRTQDREAVFREIYAYLYANCDENKVNKLIELYTGNTGLCTTKWMEETVAFKCYDCESDNTCAVCLECFFKSNHEGHRYRLTRTSGGCCDCGDNASWDPQGACSKHNAPITVYDEKELLNVFSEDFIARLKNALQQITTEITAFLTNLDPMTEQFVFVLLLFLDKLMKTAPAFRYALFDVIDHKTLSLWVKQHQILSNDVRKAFNSIYLTMLTSMAFKMLFSDVYVEHYAEIAQPFKEDPEDWHLSYLSVQLFTYSHIAIKAINEGFLEECLYPIINSNSVDPKLGTVQFPRFDRRSLGLYLRVLGDFTYLMNHDAVIKLVLSTPTLQYTLFRILGRMEMMNVIQRETEEHVQFENSGYVLAFTNEHSFLLALRPFTELCKANIALTANLYRSLNAYVRDYLCPWQFNSRKLCRSFHIPLIRFFVSVINFDHIAQLYASGAGVEELRNDIIVTVFDDEVLLHVMKQAITVIRFAMEIKNNLWLYNGESMHEQSDHYRQVVLIQHDVAAIQMGIAILGLRRRAGLTNIEPLAVLYGEAFKTHVTCQEGTNVQEQQLPGDTYFKVLLFMHLFNLVIHDIKNLEVLAVPRNNKDPNYVRRGYPLILMEIASALAMGKLEFAEVTAMVNVHWKRHPQVVQAVDQLASVNYSQVADKTYVRPKNEAYRIIDVLWHPYNIIASLSIPQEVLKRGEYNILGAPRSANLMQPEYLNAQDAVVEGIGKTKAFQVVWMFIEALANLPAGDHNDAPKHSAEGPMDTMQEPTFHDQTDENECFEDAVSELTEYFNIDIDWSGPIGNRWNESLLGAMKTINLIMETSDHVGMHNAEKLVKMLEAILSRIADDAVVKTAITHTIKKIRDTYQLVQINPETDHIDKRKQNMKSLQMKFMSKMLAQQKKIKMDDLPGDSSPDFDEEHQTCILCRQKMDDDDNRMGLMCLIATNSVMRMCTQSLGETAVYAKASLPLRSSIISSCGHVAHTRCINDHRRKQGDTHIIPVHGVQRNRDEYFCPICKALCNYTLECIPDGKVLERNETAEDRLYSLCTASWRYPFCTNWMPTPVHAKFNANPHVMYTFSVVLPFNDVTTAQTPGRSFLEEIGVRDLKYNDFNCARCLETDVFAGYNPQCRALFYPKEDDMTYIDRTHLGRQLAEWINRNPAKIQPIKRLLKIDPTASLSRRATSHYCRAVFTGQRSLYGVQNWRHANAGIEVDPKIWLLYNHIIATCSCSRNQLTVKPSLTRHLVRNYYTTGIKETGLDDQGDLTLIDTTYFDVLPEDLIVPKPTRDESISAMTVLVEAMSEKQVRQLAKAINLELVETEYHPVAPVSMETNDGQFELDVTCAWSKDVVREFLVAFIKQAPTMQKSLEYLATNIGTLIMQVIERAALSDIKKAFATFVKDSADAEVEQGSQCEQFTALRFRRDFLKTLYRTYLEGSIESAELPSNLTGRVDWMGFEEHEGAFRAYNGYSHADKELNNCPNEVEMSTGGMEIDSDIAQENYQRAMHEQMTVSNPQEEFEGAEETCCGAVSHGGDDTYNACILMNIRQRLTMAKILQEEHYKTVQTFVKTLPERPNGDIAEQVKTYMVEQIMKLLRVRQLHGLVESGITDSEFEELIQLMQSDYNAHEPTEGEERNIVNAIFAAHPPKTPQEHDETMDNTRYYKGTDFIKRINEETYKAHANFAFFEVIRHLVPAERHLVDFVQSSLQEKITQAPENCDIIQIAQHATKTVYDSLMANGYLPKDFNMDMDAITVALFKHLNVLLDIAFWIIFSVFETDAETSTKVSYAHLQEDGLRFNLLVEATGIKGLTHMVLQACSEILDQENTLKLMLMRATNHETMAPLVSAYDYINLRQNLTDDAWELIRDTTFRMCPTCGTQPPNPLLCLICGSIICHQSMCCDRNKDANVLQMLSALERNGVGFHANDMAHIYNDEVVAHTNVCGGGQGMYISPYNCFLVFMDERRHCVTHTLYADNYGNKDLHASVYGPVVLSQTKLTNIINAFCQGKLTQEIINVQKESIR